MIQIAGGEKKQKRQCIIRFLLSRVFSRKQRQKIGSKSNHYGAPCDGNPRGGGAGSQRAVIKLGPPPPEVAALVLHREEDEHAHEGRAGVQRRREDVVVPLPPPLVVAKDEEVEDGAGEEPARYVGGRGRRHSGEAVGDDGDVDEADPLLLREAPAQGPDRHGKQRADEEQPHQVPVEPAMAEEASGADEAPYDGGVEGNPVLGAGPGAVRVKRLDVAYVLDALQHPPGHSEVYDSGDQSPDQLHGSRICSATERY
ncbi:unnamed protein product [Spirodela intermedia]|uniref:Uncharacterized protein n=1 Tax=Spirodela intermedia TaxID=51605 RepID=A0A7I8K8P0_SPIIN|nr:unnamed protein product [Spirodela intermedia]